ncbi:MAG TPA: PIG-L family deacetylase [Candidatus Saccharimonadales bacterium]|nr:PIG-L family deacetylase [Candidatus Saccharimonadales bacterium]
MSKKKYVAPSKKEARGTDGFAKRVASSVTFRRGYMVFGLMVLLATTVFWAYLSARLHQGNADQLIDSYMFGSKSTFHAAEFPSAHTFLLKWPLFLLIKLCGSTAAVFLAFTVGVVVATVGAFAALLYRIERRPLVFGTICLALASVLLAVPAQPYAGALLPVNMAMVATRNLEYIAYIVALWLCVSARRVKSWRFISSIALLTLLIASDKLFLTIGVGSAVIAYIVHRTALKVGLVYAALRWFSVTVVASIAALLLLWVVNAAGVTHFTNQVDAGGSYGVVHGLHGFVLAGTYAVLGLFTNFGANPAYDATVLSNIPGRTGAHLASWGGVAFLVNLGVLVVGLGMTARLVRVGFQTPEDKQAAHETHAKVAILLIWSAVAAVLAFMLTDHYYAVDARYLTVAFFAVFVAAAVYMARKNWQARTLLAAGLVLLVAIASGVFVAARSYNEGKTALQTVNDRNLSVAQALSHHPVATLVGDYWRVVPTKLAANNRLNILPLASCGQVRDALTSDAWRTDLRKYSFAYLLSFDQNLTGYQNCTLEEIIKSYGRPNASTIIAGNLAEPQELLLFYDRGAFHSAPKPKHATKDTSASQDASTILPVSLASLPNVSCGQNPTVMNIVAHQDDDLLFMNPELEHSVSAGSCVRTVYMTAGDDGADKYYWLSREHGSEAAYSTMTPQEDSAWIERQVALSDHQFMTVASPKNNPGISLIFMHLPDGNVDGRGFRSSHFESLARLDSNKIPLIHSVDGQSSYDATELQQALAELMKTYQPTEVRTQANFIGHQYPDHSDHMAVGRFASRAFSMYSHPTGATLRFFIGYPVHQMPPNVDGDDLARKEAAFFAYARFDGGVCQDQEQCAHTPTYGSYLRRQYENPY